MDIEGLRMLVVKTVWMLNIVHQALELESCIIIIAPRLVYFWISSTINFSLPLTELTRIPGDPRELSSDA